MSQRVKKIAIKKAELRVMKEELLDLRSEEADLEQRLEEVQAAICYRESVLIANGCLLGEVQ